MPSPLSTLQCLFDACVGVDLAPDDPDDGQGRTPAERERAAHLGPVLASFFSSAVDLRAALHRREAPAPRRPPIELLREGRATSVRERRRALPAAFVIMPVDATRFQFGRTRVHAPLARRCGADCEVPVRAGVPEPEDLNRALVASVEARGNGFAPAVYGEHPDVLTRLILVAALIRLRIEEGGADLPVQDPEIVLDACAQLPRADQDRLSEEDLACLLAYTFWCKAVTPSPGPAKREKEKEKGRHPQKDAGPLARPEGPRGERRSAFDQSKV